MKGEMGVNVFGYVYAESGVGEHTRLLVASLKDAGIPYSVVPFSRTESRQKRDFSDFGSGEAQFDINIVGVNADSLPYFVDKFGQSILEDRYTIGLWAWEVEKFPEWMARSADLVDEVWANSSFSARAIASAICRPTMPFPLPIAAPQGPRMSRAEFGLPEGVLFLFCCDLDSVVERKNPVAVVQAFSKAFRVGEGPALMVKTVNGHRCAPAMKALSAAADGRPDIIIRDGYLSSEKQAALMASCDSYVSLHRAEGFGLSLGEAMALGKPVIATAYSGNLDFMTPFNSFLVQFSLIPVGPDCDPYPPDARWADPDVDSAAQVMRTVVEFPELARRKGLLGQREVLEQHGTVARGALVKQRLSCIENEQKKWRLVSDKESANSWRSGTSAGEPGVESVGGGAHYRIPRWLRASRNRRDREILMFSDSAERLAGGLEYDGLRREVAARDLRLMAARLKGFVR